MPFMTVPVVDVEGVGRVRLPVGPNEDSTAPVECCGIAKPRSWTPFMPRCLATGGTVKDGCAPKEQAMKNKHTPMLRLRSAPVGSIVALPAIQHHKSFYLGGRDADGYSYLWASKGAKDDGMNWLVMAAGSHEVVMA